ncbi:MAG: helix-turn-helix transcriptional regulator [Firmicutes bacterium]|nr:helix-turn-helix transcriptional regulator [Bacillota bacterium]
MKLSDKIIKLRKAKGWSQEDFAEKLNVSRQAVSRWENGTALPDANNILQLSKLFAVSADYLLNEDCGGDETVHAVTEVNAAAAAEKKKDSKLQLVASIAFAIAGLIWLFMAIDNLNLTHAVLAAGNAALSGINLYLYEKGRKKDRK